MKKFVCLLMVTLLAMSLVVSVSAALLAEPCSCGGTYTYATSYRNTRTGSCPYDGTHTIKDVYRRYRCSDCGDVMYDWEYYKTIYSCGECD